MASAASRSAGSGERTSTGSPVKGCSNASRPAWRNCRSSPRSPRDAVGPVARDRQVDRREMDADLVRPPRLERDAEQRVAPEQLVDLEVRHRFARRVGVERVPLRVAAVAADRRLDRALRERGRPTTSARYSRVSSRTRTSSCRRRCASGERATTSRPEVSRSSRCTIPGRSGSSPPSTSYASRPCTSVPCAWPGAGMNDEARRLVDDQQVLVLVRDGEIHRLGLERALRRGGRLELDLLAADELVALQPHAPVDEHAARSEQSLGDGARADLGQFGEEAVESPAGGVVRDVQPHHGRAAPGAAPALQRRAQRGGCRRRSR